MTFPYFKKSYKEKLKDAFTKTFDQIYAQYSKPEKMAYWAIIIAGFSVIAYVWVAKLKVF
jgi:hypothetical protein